MKQRDERERVTKIEPEFETGTIWVKTNDRDVARSMRKAWYPKTKRGQWWIFAVPMTEEMLAEAGERA